MIIFIAIILVVLSFVLLAFLSFAPNVYTLIEKDFMRRVQHNAQVCGYKYGQISYRAKTLEQDVKTLDLGHVKKRNNLEVDDAKTNITLSVEQATDSEGRPYDVDKINVDFKYTPKQPSSGQ